MSDQVTPLVDLFPTPFRYPHDIRDVRYCDERAFGPAGTVVTPDSPLVDFDFVYWSHEELFDLLYREEPENRRAAYFYRIDEKGQPLPGTVRAVSYEQLNHIVAVAYGVENKAPLLISVETKLEAPAPVWSTVVVADVRAAEKVLQQYLHANPRRSTPDFYPAESRIREALDLRGIYRTQFREPRGTGWIGRDITVEFCDSDLTHEFNLSLFGL